MNKEKLSKFLDAVDVVCLECIEGNDEKCVDCPVRHSVDYFKECGLPYFCSDLKE